MVRCSNTIVGGLNVFVFLLSVLMLVTGIYLSLNGTKQCERFLDKPMIALGVLLMVISIAGVVGSFCKVTWLLWSYLFVMFFIIVIFLSFTIFAFVVTNKGSGETIPGKAYKEYRLKDYSDWFQKRVKDAKHWNNIKSCIAAGGFCTYLEVVTGPVPVSAFNKLKLNSLESGCCKPSNDCNFIYTSPTKWNKTTDLVQFWRHKNSDCKLWDNDSKKLCYDCQACKAGFVDNLQAWWRSLAIGNIVFLIILIVFFAIGCHALINNQREDAYARSDA